MTAAAIEAVQFFTVSHVADPADLTGAWICGGLGVALGAVLLAWRPDLHRQPLRVLRGLVVVTVIVLLAWGVLSVLLREKMSLSATTSWLPMVSNFHRPWNSLLGDYATGFLQYGMIAGLVALWYRSGNRRPGQLVIIAAAVSSALLASVVALYRQIPIDTGQFFLALLAGAVAVRLDLALFGQRALLSAWARLWCHSPDDISPRQRRESTSPS